MKKIIDNYQYEQALYNEGYEYVAGIDEVGRGPLAGPVVASCVIMPKGFYVEGITDSKQVSLKKRLEFNQIILDNAIAVATVFIDEKVIDEINIYEATKKAMLQTLEEIKIKPEYVLIDAMPLDFNIPHASIIKGDAKSFMIACASIVAKIARDNYMDELDKIYPKYGFKKNKGYPTKAHREALLKYGVTEVHRKTYGPVKKAIEKLHPQYEQQKLL